ncbi:MAG: DUF5822 domain-containing protein [Halobacteriales archaeon]|nr:DUF5822 domain-containing protein [Halobacteriales archaeon]
MQVTFVTTIVVGAPVVAVCSLFFELSSWGAWASFAIRVGALVWFITAVCVYFVARRRADSVDGNESADENADENSTDEAASVDE